MSKMRVFALSLVLGVIPLASVFAQYQPPAGTDSVSSYLSPSFLAGGPSVTSQESPQADVVNPAAGAAKQRVTLDANYLGLVGTLPGEGWLGHIANIGATFPTKFGVFNASGHFLTSSLAAIDLGTYGALNASFAKQLYSDLYIGVGLNGSLGVNTAFDWGLSGSLGFIALPGDVGFLKNFSWGAALQNIGKGFAPVALRSAYPAPFTPVLGASFDVLDSKSLKVGFTGDVGFPSFQDVNVRVGGRITFQNSLALTISTGADLQELLNPGLGQRSLIPSVGLSYTFKTKLPKKSQFLSQHGWDTTEVKTQAAAAPMQGGVWAFGAGANAALGVIDHTPPVIKVDYPHPTYISPNNDGIKDFLEFPISITDNRYVLGYSLDIYNQKGTLVRDIQNKEQRPENKGVQSVIERLFAVKHGIAIPPTLRWHGLNNNGQVVPDGTYTFVVKAWDDNGNVATSPRYTVHVDDTPPQVTIHKPKPVDLIFSPNGDGNKDTLKIVQSGSKEQLWTGKIETAAGKVVRTFHWKDSRPKDFVWNGNENNGKVAPDGVYKYVIAATDRAGNTGGASLDNIIINTEATPARLSIQYSYFSPNGDGVKDVDEITPHVPVKSGIVSWKIDIKNAQGATVRQFSGGSTPPHPIYFDGRTEKGVPLPQGPYSAALSIVYDNGNTPKATSPLFHIDLSRPQASVTANYTVFSPNGDGKKDTITFYQDTTKEPLWKGAIYDAQGKKVKTFSWVGTADSKVVWNGRGNNGLVVPNGTYTYRIEATDRGGNTGKSNTVTFQVNTEKTPVFLSVEYPAFSPNADGVKDTMKIYPQLRVVGGVESYQLSIRSAAGKTVRTFSGQGMPPSSFTWGGLNDQGNPVSDGTYQAFLKVTYANGNTPTAPSPSFLLDTKYPQISAKANRTLFSPNGDGHKDTVTITNNSSSEKLWTAEILNSSGKVVLTKDWKGKAGTFVWDGTDAQGNKVPNGSYTYVISSTDIAGNTSRAVIHNIVVDNQPTPVYVTAGANGFSPNGDGVDDTISFQTVVGVNQGVQSWKLDIVAMNGKVVRSYSGGSRIPSSVTWDGKSSTGSVTQGRYYARFKVVYDMGNEPVAKTQPFLLDIAGPKLSVTISPLPFTPDNDGVNDELNFAVKVQDQSPISTWKLHIYDPKDHLFKTFSGTGKPASTITWDGKSNSGELVSSAEDYPYSFEVTDAYGNSTQVHGSIPVGILVIKQGNQLRIRVASIIFAPNSASLNTADPQVQAKNKKILDRLAEILKKYDRYKIRIEGFAVSVYWYDPAKAKVEQKDVLIPLSRARAQTVKDALVKRGIAAKRMTVKGLGDLHPVVPNSDLKDRWKNRRVEFILIK